MKEKIFNLLQPGKQESKSERYFDLFIVILIILNIVMIFATTFELSPSAQTAFQVLDVFSIIVFTIEYILRVWTSTKIYPELTSAKARFKYMLTPMAIIDLLAVLPFYLITSSLDFRVLRMPRVVRLLRVFKMKRYSASLSIIGKVFKNKASQLISATFVVLLLMVIASVIMYGLENPAQPDVFKNAFSGIWWAVVTFTTVGYGDMIPITIGGRILGSIISFLGIGLLAVPTGIISAGFIEVTNEKEQDEKRFCPYCGKKIE